MIDFVNDWAAPLFAVLGLALVWMAIRSAGLEPLPLVGWIVRRWVWWWKKRKGAETDGEQGEKDSGE